MHEENETRAVKVTEDEHISLSKIKEVLDGKRLLRTEDLVNGNSWLCRVSLRDAYHYVVVYPYVDAVSEGQPDERTWFVGTDDVRGGPPTSAQVYIAKALRAGGLRLGRGLEEASGLSGPDEWDEMILESDAA